MKTNAVLNAAQRYFRLSLAIGFLLAVFDRTGLLGAPGTNNVSWGNWDNFVAYTNMLMPFAGKGFANVMGGIATVAEVVFALQLIVGYKTKAAAWGSFALTLAFGLSMFIFTGYKGPFTYSVFMDSAGALLVAGLGYYKWSVDAALAKTE
jgi:uncharacterized membrane protein YphA (DoxX/SURF4 family)